jgi:uncharacterized glyoxalase superfamily protein PhnB
MRYTCDAWRSHSDEGATMADENWLGGCFCGEVRYRVAGPGTDLCFCHCTSCRRATGVPSVAWGTFERDRFEVIRGRLNERNSSAEVFRGFCPNCGSSLTYRHLQRSSEIDVTLATLDDAAAFAPRTHIWIQDKLPWVSISDGLPQYQTVRKADAGDETCIRPGYRTLTTRIVARDARALAAFLQQVFGASGDYHAEHPTQMQIGDSSLLISDVGERDAMPAFVYVYVADVDASYERALKAGARSIEAPTLVAYGDYRCMIADHWGNTWQVAKFVR